ncbi:deoxyribonuclease IV [Desulfonatronovibrio hydrogenovorans]|uniref:deoxyribonuclease IV n=1 Tax=Desulfonatronovibrio hydrogenovorans TaxID=53245 RepID=UPI00048D6669|nr:deoxyribonuclease IV [Desulfonatronovibrio hydrogenovorans]
MPGQPLLGAHCSTAGGLNLAVQRIMDLGGQALQIFTRNQRQWNPRPLNDQETDLFKQARQLWGSYPVMAHDSYLINLANPDEQMRSRSIKAQARELERCALLGIDLLVTHPGAHKGQGVDKGIKTYVRSLDESLATALELHPDTSRVMVLLETTSGQGTVLGRDFNELAAIIQACTFPDRLGVCLDTCHMFAAGYDLRTEKSYFQVMASLDRTVGLDRVRAVHLNDTRTPLGSSRDRHEHIGKGELGLEAFRLVLNDPALANTPMVLETPKDKAGQWDRQNLETLHSLLRT